MSPQTSEPKTQIAVMPAYINTEDDVLTLSTSPGPHGQSAECTLEYLNEGGANFIISIVPCGEHPLPDRARRRLLRLRKESHTQPVIDQLKALEAHFKPLFPVEHLVEHELIALDNGMVSMLSGFPKALASLRPANRIDDTLAVNEMFGTLVTDMTPGKRETLLQLKPKWLAQSPNAPADSKRCRTCALRAQRASKDIMTATDAQESCPLDLVHEREVDRLNAAMKLTADPDLQRYLAYGAQQLLTCIRRYQQQFDLRGALEVVTEEEITDTCKAMTLRDCTLYVLKYEDGAIEARLGDLDRKLREKLPKWQKFERSLIDGGWYTNTEEANLRKKEKICLLSRSKS